MPDSLAAMLALFNDNTAGDISAADGRAIIQALYDWIPPTEKYKMGRLSGETAHAADDFFSAYSGYTEVDPTGTTAWSVTRGGLSCLFEGQVGSDVAATVKAVPAAGVPITIETQVFATTSEENSAGFGLLFSDGTAATSNIAGIGFLGTATLMRMYRLTGTFTAATATIVTGATAQHPQNNVSPFIRLTWIAANTFGWSVSPDTENWTTFDSVDFTPTITPTHMGLLATAWGGAGNRQVASFKYLRVYEADLSV